MNKSQVNKVSPYRGRFSGGYLKPAFISAGWGILVASFIPFFGEYSRWLDHFSAFRFQYLWLSGLLLVYFIVKKQRVGVAVSAVSLLLNTWYVVPWLDASQTGNHTKANFRIFHANVLFKNLDYGPVTAQIRQENPDFISINEATLPFIRHFRKAFAKEYPFSVYVDAKNKTKVLVAGRYPFALDSTATFSGKGVVKFKVFLKVKPLVVIACHAYNPLVLSDFNMRNEQLKKIAQWVRQETDPVVVAGDLNITPWSVFYDRFIRESGLQNCRKGFGLQPTWPAWVFPLMIPIDHCLVSRQLETVAFRLGKPTKSDHLPVIIDLRFTASSALSER
ncbi:MAG: endonuclease/exonuclease/phosphatase family protein [Spirosomataceae bacterium]